VAAGRRVASEKLGRRAAAIAPAASPHWPPWLVGVGGGGGGGAIFAMHRANTSAYTFFQSPGTQFWSQSLPAMAHPSAATSASVMQLLQYPEFIDAEQSGSPVPLCASSTDAAPIRRSHAATARNKKRCRGMLSGNPACVDKLIMSFPAIRHLALYTFRYFQ
jgi:hypothetical protein